MSDEPTERDVEALWRWFHNYGDGGVWETFDRPNSKVVARAVLTSDWYAERITEARREGAAEVEARVEATIAPDGAPMGTLDTLADPAAVFIIERVRAALRGDA